MVELHTRNDALKGPRRVAQGHNNVDLITLLRQIGITYQVQKNESARTAHKSDLVRS